MTSKSSNQYYITWSDKVDPEADLGAKAIWTNISSMSNFSWSPRRHQCPWCVGGTEIQTAYCGGCSGRKSMAFPWYCFSDDY